MRRAEPFSGWISAFQETRLRGFSPFPAPEHSPFRGCLTQTALHPGNRASVMRIKVLSRWGLGSGFTRTAQAFSPPTPHSRKHVPLHASFLRIIVFSGWGLGRGFTRTAQPFSPPTPHSGKHVPLHASFSRINVFSGWGLGRRLFQKGGLPSVPLTFLTSGRRRQRWPALPIHGRPRFPSGRRSRRIPVRRRPW